MGKGSLLYSRMRNKFFGGWGFFILPEISVFLTVGYVKTSQIDFEINFLSVLGPRDET